jgi:hypothetical protein
MNVLIKNILSTICINWAIPEMTEKTELEKIESVRENG